MSFFGDIAKSVVTEAASGAAGALVSGVFGPKYGGGGQGTPSLLSRYGSTGSAGNRAPSRSFNSTRSMYGQTQKAESSRQRGDNIVFPTGDDPAALAQKWDSFFSERSNG